MNFGDWLMRLAVCLIGAAAVLTGAGAAEAASVQLRDAVARVTVVPEDRADVKVEFLATNPKLPLNVSTSGATTVIDGGLAHRIRDCHRRPDHPSAWVRGVGRVEADAMPQLVIRTPRDVVLSASGAVFGAVGRSASLDLQDSGCDVWTIGDTAGEARIQESGAGAIRMGSADHLEAHLSGAGDVHAVTLRRGLAAHVSGAGGVNVEEVSGPLTADISGLGHVRVAGGRASDVRASVSGMGGVEFGGSAETLRASISGVGNVHVKQVTGAVTKSVSGLGHVTVDQPRS